MHLGVFSEGRGTLAPIDPPKYLVVRGLYTYVRNPLYVSVVMTLIGEAIFFMSAPVLIEGRSFHYSGAYVCGGLRGAGATTVRRIVRTILTNSRALDSAISIQGHLESLQHGQACQRGTRCDTPCRTAQNSEQGSAEVVTAVRSMG